MGRGLTPSKYDPFYYAKPLNDIVPPSASCSENNLAIRLWWGGAIYVYIYFISVHHNMQFV